MIRSNGLWLLPAALALAACDFPPVPRGADSGINEGAWLSPIPGPATPPRYAVGGEEVTAGEEPLGEPREIRGRLVGNAVSSYVVETDEGWVTMQITTRTQLRIGDQPAGLREIQPGTEVRASFVPAGEGRQEIALEVVADSENPGWRGRGASEAQRTESRPADQP